MRPGASLRSVARDLAVAGVLPDERVLVALARWRGVDRAIKAGNYEVAGGITLPQLLDKLTQGDVTQTSLTVVEGSTYAELLALLGRKPGRRGARRSADGRRRRPRTGHPRRQARRAGSSRTRTSSPPAPASSRCCGGATS